MITGGPLSINTKRIMETNGEWSVGVNQILLMANGEMGVPSTDFMRNWLPSELERTKEGLPIHGTRPWITKHSVGNMIYTLKWKNIGKSKYLGQQTEEKSEFTTRTKQWKGKQRLLENAHRGIKPERPENKR